MCGGQRQPQVSFFRSYLQSFLTVSHWPGTHQVDLSGWPACTGSAPLCLPSTGYKYTRLCRVFFFFLSLSSLFPWVLGMILSPYTCREALHWLSDLSSPFLTSSEEQLSSAQRAYVVQTSLTFISRTLDLTKLKFWIYQTTAPHPLLSTLRSELTVLLSVSWVWQGGEPFSIHSSVTGLLLF